MIQTEGILNSRPLTPLSSDEDNFDVLTPGRFLIGRPISSIPEPFLTDINENRLSRWQRTTKVVQLIWKKWKSDYLNTLQARSKWMAEEDDLIIGQMILIKDDFLPINTWLLGRMLEVYYGSDGKVRVVKANDFRFSEFCTSFFRSDCMRTLLVENLNADLQSALSKVKSLVDEFGARGSGWLIDFIEHLELKVATYTLVAGSSYIPTPDKTKYTSSIVNVKNNDNKCVMWSMLAALHPAKTNPQFVSKYAEFASELKFEPDMIFPFTLNKVTKFETLNDISIKVFGYEKTVFPLYITEKKYATHVNLLFQSNTETKHFCYIKNMSRLLSSLSKHDGKSFS
ncbi:hypothetical protein AVEN_222540-1 [Araneus ventricosus]|uniref:DUF5641 domain-containing protein n=1 Tax=Araneus ventricosus TaxID=182803 RepID=A0A4Y2GV90_ARAVE|nr:hypothetical protein AVEN_222540-1 [Araneus ventricosus]